MEDKIEQFKAKNIKATLNDIAKITSLSVGAVSQALNPSSKTTIGLSEKSIIKVREVAKKINYRTHWGAVSTRRNFLYNLAFIHLETKSNKHKDSPFLSSFAKAANANNFAVSFLSIDNTVNTLPSLFKNNRLDGIVIDGSQNLAIKLEAELENSNIPYITINKKLEANAICVDEVLAGSEITNYLIERRHKKILFLKPKHDGQNSSHHSLKDREKGYVKAMNLAGLNVEIQELLLEESLGYNERIDSSWLDFKNLPDAILAYDDDLANSVAKMLYRKNIAIPSEISLASFGGDYATLSAWCPLSTMRIPSKEMGKKAFEMLFCLIENQNKESQKLISFKSSLIIGESTK